MSRALSFMADPALAAAATITARCSSRPVLSPSTRKSRARAAPGESCAPGSRCPDSGSEQDLGLAAGGRSVREIAGQLERRPGAVAVLHASDLSSVSRPSGPSKPPERQADHVEFAPDRRGQPRGASAVNAGLELGVPAEQVLVIG